MCLLHDCWCVYHDNDLVMWTQRNLKLSTLFTTGSLVPIVHDQLFYLADVEGEVVILAPHWQVTDLAIGCLVVIGDQAYHRRVISKLNDGLEVMHGKSVMDKQGVQEGTEHAPLGPLC